jgi:hypothetical protein
MGPGYFPVAISLLICLVGIAVLIRGLTTVGPPLTAIGVRPIVLVCAALLLFGVAIEALGLAITTVLMTLVAALARRDTRWVPALALSLLLAAFAVLLFIYALDQPLSVFGRLFL